MDHDQSSTMSHLQIKYVYLTDVFYLKGEYIQVNPLARMVQAEAVKWVNLSSECWPHWQEWGNPGKTHKTTVRSLAQNYSFVSDALFSHLDRDAAKYLVFL